MRLEQVLFSQGFGTRHECRGLIALKRVTFDGELVTDPDVEVDPIGRKFTVNEQTWPYYEKALILLNKPAGYECSQKPLHHPSVMNLLPGPLRVRDVQPVGRLDADTTGLLLLTDDGALQHRLTHPKKHVSKCYRVTCKHSYDDRLLHQLLQGVKLVDEKVPLKAQSAERVDEVTLDMVITSGKYHQVKRMVAAAGNRVESLQRIAFGSLKLPENLKEGEWLWLSGPEVILQKK